MIHQFNKQMKLSGFLTMTFLLASLNACVLEQVSITERFEQKREVQGKYDKCIEEIAEATAEIGVIGLDIASQNWIGIVEGIAKLGKKIYQIVECFKNIVPKNFEELQETLIEMTGRMVTMGGDSLQCYIDHAKEALGELKTLVSDLSKGDMSAVEKDLADVQATFQDAVQNC